MDTLGGKGFKKMNGVLSPAPPFFCLITAPTVFMVARIMLAAFDTETEGPLNMPDFEAPEEIESLRAWTRSTRVVCPTCKGKLIVRAGGVRISHFAHKVLKDCPNANSTFEVMFTRTLLYRFFKNRKGFEGAKVLLEVDRPDLLNRPFDVVVERVAGRTDALLCLEKRLSFDWRKRVSRNLLSEDDLCILPVFLRPPQEGEGPRDVFLTPDMRELRKISPFNAFPNYRPSAPGTLHYCDVHQRKWISFRGLDPVHEPQVFRFRAKHECAFDQLNWSEQYADFVTAPETEQEDLLIQEYEAARRERLRQEARQCEQERSLDKEYEFGGMGTARQSVQPTARGTKLFHSPEPRSTKAFGELTCKGCGIVTADWKIGKPDQNLCVCRQCFSEGVRL